MYSLALLTKSCLHTSARILKKAPQNMKGKRASDQRWIARQLNDPFVKAAHDQNYRCRSAFKLIEIDDKYKILKPGYSVIDCGAAPGAWSQVAVQRVNSAGANSEVPIGFVVGVDLLRLTPLDGAHFLSFSDVTDQSIQTQLQELLPSAQADVILSDMAPNASGFRELDHERLVTICLSVADLVERVLRPGGSLICKYWDGALAHHVQSRLASTFCEVRTVKPKSCRKESAEVYFLARFFKKNPKQIHF
ncbi:hypothetical protein AGOR_G00228480 [Albula goreensis]|uniref:rRNA methyltransferase 2, mitochondrial n=1 Tax=Albula goreensis TaxID=1534307 RepID=A0A8T3CL02_9TELE|nr:hypothetical protein AGOR_G00228480 [Albula goreensis]